MKIQIVLSLEYKGASILEEYVEQLKEKLNWYIYEASYDEYNSQEVNYIIQQLHEIDPEYEKQICDTCFTFPITLLHNNNFRIEITKNKKISYSKTVITVLLSVAIFSAMFWRFDSETMAIMEKGFFHFISRDENNITFIYSPTYNPDVTYSSFDELPDNIQEIVWKPQNNIYDFELTDIKVTYKEGSIQKIVEYFEDCINNDFFSIEYNLSESITVGSSTLISSTVYNDIVIDYYLSREIDSYKEYMFVFTYSNTVYKIKFKNIDIANEILYDLIEYLKN